MRAVHMLELVANVERSIFLERVTLNWVVEV